MTERATESPAGAADAFDQLMWMDAETGDVVAGVRDGDLIRPADPEQICHADPHHLAQMQALLDVGAFNAAPVQSKVQAFDDGALDSFIERCEFSYPRQ